MTRRRGAIRGSVVAVAAAIMALGLAACGSRSPGERPAGAAVRLDGRPNVVFVLTDDLAMNLLPYMPHVQALIQAGMSFKRYFVVDSLCCPSRTSIFTGEYPHNDGVFTNGGSDGGYGAYNRFGNPAKSFAIGLKSAGYQTAFMGKYLNGYQPSDPPPPGWDTWVAAGNGYPEFDYALNENGTIHRYGNRPNDYLTSVLGDKAVQFIQGNQLTGKPFALEVATFAPHKPWVPAPQDVGTFPTIRAPRSVTWDRTPRHAPPWLAALPRLDRLDVASIDRAFRLRVEAVQSVDRMVGRLEATLAALHQLRNTYFVFSSDNGFHMGDYRMLPGKTTAFDTDIRVPLIVAGPGIRPGSTTNTIASSIDLAPTFLQIAGAQPTGSEDGVSLLGLLHGQSPPPTWQRAVLIEHHGPVTNPSDPDVQPHRAGNPPSYEALRTANWLYVEYVTGYREYYNLARDPHEIDNVVGSLSARRRAQLHRELLQMQACQGSTQCQAAAAAVR